MQHLKDEDKDPYHHMAYLFCTSIINQKNDVKKKKEETKSVSCKIIVDDVQERSRISGKKQASKRVQDNIPQKVVDITPQKNMEQNMMLTKIYIRYWKT